MARKPPSPPLGPLDGLRVIDLTQMLAGPYCTMLLADQGAEVVKVEPLDGDGTRLMGPHRVDDRLKLFGGYFQSVNRNKLSIAIDLKQAEGRALLMRLVDTAAVLVENYRAGVMDRLGLAYETLRVQNRKLVYASIRGFGDPRTGKSPYVEWPAYDVVAQAMGGIMGITGPNAETPIKVGPGVGDLVPAVMAAFGIMAAVYRAEKTGEGQYVDVGMVDAVLSLCERIVHQFFYQENVPGPEGNRHPFLSPFGIVPAKDGYVALACHADEFWAELCRLMGREELASDPRYATRQARAEHQDLVYAAVGDFTRRHTKHDLMGILGGHVPFGPVFDVSDIVADPHFKVRQMIVPLEHPGSPTKVAVAGIPIRMTETPGSIRRRAPLLGEDTDAVLGMIGMKPAEVARLREHKIVK
ncbi:MAG TPA: CoA transferase [Candidatus Sulfotelmatobacter sp.]|nr:CoA transferase [Candidatus Sulfotelmatobacter sp.]